DVKEVSTEYWNYFIQLFKNPTEALRHTENEFINGIINIILYAVTFGIGIYYTINALDTITMGELSHLLHGKKGMPFFPIFIRVALTAIIALACTLICIIMIEKFFVKQMTFKQQLTQYDGIYNPYFSIDIYYTINDLDTITMEELSHLLHSKKGMPFFPIFIRVALTAIIALACTLICIIMIEKLFVKQMTFKQQLTQYAGILTPFIAVNLLIVLTGLGGSFGLAISLALLSLFTTTFIYGAIF